MHSSASHLLRPRDRRGAQLGGAQGLRACAGAGCGTSLCGGTRGLRQADQPLVVPLFFVGADPPAPPATPRGLASSPAREPVDSWSSPEGAPAGGRGRHERPSPWAEGRTTCTRAACRGLPGGRAAPPVCTWRGPFHLSSPRMDRAPAGPTGRQRTAACDLGCEVKRAGVVESGVPGAGPAAPPGASLVWVPDIAPRRCRR